MKDVAEMPATGKDEWKKLQNRCKFTNAITVCDRCSMAGAKRKTADRKPAAVQERAGAIAQ